MALILAGFSTFYQPDPASGKRKKPKALYVGKALADWHSQRSYPGETINMTGISEGYASMRQNLLKTTLFPGTWEDIGPKNFGGRTLALCFNPLNPNTIYAGSASGGLWRTYSGGAGATAWHQVETGFPVLGVAAISINPLDSNEIFIGTGEVYNDQNTGTGFAVRTTRGTYGIGILKTTNGGGTWVKSLDWQFDDLRGVQDIIMNPLRPATLFAATTEGTYRSYDSGQTWNLVESTRMATDLLMMPGDTTIVFVAAGNSFSSNPGIYRSVNGGNSFTKITNGLPSTFSGKAMLDVCLSNPQILYASIGEQLSGLGLYRSDNGGLNWFQVNSTDFQTYQGWYSHDVLVNPSDPQVVIASGINVWKSYNGGIDLTEKAFWNNWDFNATTVGGPEGPPDYVHADIHRMYYHPQDIIYLATDGGIFRSLDDGETFEGCNGGYQTQQFYANFSCSATDSSFAIGGMQDNATAVYEGNAGWRRVIGGDGLSTAIHPVNDQIVYGSAQYLNVFHSTDKAQTFNGIPVQGNTASPYTNFAGPFVLCPSSPNTLYAGRNKVYKSTDGGQNWNVTNNNNILDGNAVLVLEVSRTSSSLVYAATAPVIVPQPGLFKTTNGGTSWTNVTAGIPNRYIMDVAINPSNNDVVFVVVSGFGTPHLYKSVNAGASWSSFGTGLPDVPANSITIDPLNPAIMYLGNDIGIYVSIDAGATWQPFNDGLIDGTFVMDISISPSNRKLRLATHGKGIYEREMLPVTITGMGEIIQNNSLEIGPNPVINDLNVVIENVNPGAVLFIFDMKGSVVRTENNPAKRLTLNLETLKSGRYYVVVESADNRMVRSFVKL